MTHQHIEARNHLP